MGFCVDARHPHRVMGCGFAELTARYRLAFEQFLVRKVQFNGKAEVDIHYLCSKSA